MSRDDEVKKEEEKDEDPYKYEMHRDLRDDIEKLRSTAAAILEGPCKLDNLLEVQITQLRDGLAMHKRVVGDLYSAYETVVGKWQTTHDEWESRGSNLDDSNDEITELKEKVEDLGGEIEDREKEIEKLEDTDGDSEIDVANVLIWGLKAGAHYGDVVHDLTPFGADVAKRVVCGVRVGGDKGVLLHNSDLPNPIFGVPANHIAATLTLSEPDADCRKAAMLEF